MSSMDCNADSRAVERASMFDAGIVSVGRRVKLIMLKINSSTKLLIKVIKHLEMMFQLSDSLLQDVKVHVMV